jgi:phenylpropionate dioxygenase-like ring-hydroxylating dioxygenase large terminal subunit
MIQYTGNPDAIRNLVQQTAVHRDLYIDEELFELERKHLFANTWAYVGHCSQIPNAGDYYTTEIGEQPVMMIRHSDNSVRVLFNRCPHKGVKVAGETCGNTGRFLRCPYHAWTFHTDGRLLAIPLRKGYENTDFQNSEAVHGLRPVKHVRIHRDFVFARLSDHGADFEEYFGEALSTIDNMVDRSPVGRLEITGGVLRYVHRCNWKMLVENLTDTCHPMAAHEASAATALEVWKQHAARLNRPPMAIEILAPFQSPLEFFEKMGIRVWPNGHGHTGVSRSVHSNYSDIPDYWDMMVGAYGEERARQILSDNRHNTVYFPNFTVKGPIQTIRIFKPLAVDRTIVESWSFRLVSAPEQLLERTLMYNRIVNAPTSFIGHDDLEMYERAQNGLRASANLWVNTQRLYDDAEQSRGNGVTNGTTEWQIRNQHRAWVKYMTVSM